jgi:hypothetical protein
MKIGLATVRLIACSVMAIACLSLHGDGQPKAGDETDGAVAAVSSTPESDGEGGSTLLARVREKADRSYADLVNFTCRERIERFKGKLGSSAEPRMDVITSSVVLENGEERYVDIRQNNRILKSISDVNGAWSEGEFCTLLREATKILSVNEGRFTAPRALNGKLAFIYMSDFDTINSPWDIRLGSKHYTIPFRGEMWIDPASAEVLRITRRATSMPDATHIAEVNWSVDFAHTVLDGREFLLPGSGRYDVSYANSYRHEWNTIYFSDYHRYAAEVAVHFR